MQFSVNYKSKYKDQAGEIKCSYNQLGLIINFIKENPNKRYNITIDKELTDIDKLLEQVDIVREITDNYTIECGNGDLELLKVLISRGYNAYLKFFVTDWEFFQNLIDIGVSDIFIDGPICFDVNKLNKISNKAKLRMSPTVSPNASITKRTPSSFFVRPEDINLYDGVIDYIDFCGDDIDREEALFSIYDRGSFFFDISSLLPGLPRVNNTLFKEDFATARLSCGQKCKIPGYSCHYCDTYFSILEKSQNLIK